MSELQETRGKFLPAFFVEPVQLGGEYEILPLHITLFPPVESVYDLDNHGSVMRSYTHQIKPFDVMVGEDALFGPDHDVPVKRIESSPELQYVHVSLVRAVGHLLHDSTYRRPYRPHITKDEADTIRTGEIIHVGGLSIAIKTPQHSSWIVVDKMRLKAQ